MRVIALDEIFEATYGVNLEMNKMNVDSQGIPFVSRQEKNNGISAFVELIDGISPNPGNTLSVAVSGSVLETFYQENPYYSGRDLYYLKPKLPFSKTEMLYYCMAIRANKYRYSYGRQANKTLRKLMLPHPDDIPAWVKDTKFPVKPSNVACQDKNIKLNFENWKEFCLDDIFKISGSKTTPLKELERAGAGDFPYVTTQATNNGVKGFFDFYTEEGNCLCVDSAVVGYTSYQENNFSASDHVEILRLKEKELNKFIALFLVVVLNQETYRYSYGRKRSQEKLKNEIIKLPATADGTPDWEFMENYIKSLPYSSNLE